MQLYIPQLSFAYPASLIIMTLFPCCYAYLYLIRIGLMRLTFLNSPACSAGPCYRHCPSCCAPLHDLDLNLAQFFVAFDGFSNRLLFSHGQCLSHCAPSTIAGDFFYNISPQNVISSLKTAFLLYAATRNCHYDHRAIDRYITAMRF